MTSALVGSALHIAGAHIEVLPDAVVSTYDDGACARFYPPVRDRKFQKCARQFGYADVLQYGLEHDVCHHLIAEAMGWPHSRVIWCAAHENNWKLYSHEQRWDEEHLAVRMQKFINTGQVDPDFGVLEGVFGDRLGAVAAKIMIHLRPWLDVRAAA